MPISNSTVQYDEQEAQQEPAIPATRQAGLAHLAERFGHGTKYWKTALVKHKHRELRASGSSNLAVGPSAIKSLDYSAEYL